MAITLDISGDSGSLSEVTRVQMTDPPGVGDEHSLVFDNTVRRVADGYSWKFQLDGGDDGAGDGRDRTECLINDYPADFASWVGKDDWWGASLRLPSGFSRSTLGSSPTNIFLQWHQKGQAGGGIPPFSITINQFNDLQLRVIGGLGGFPSANATKWVLLDMDDPANYDRWIDFKWYVKWHNDPSIGAVQMYVDDVLKVPLTNLSTMYDVHNYLKFGYYRNRDADKPRQTVWWDQIQRGDAEEDIDLDAIPETPGGGGGSGSPGGGGGDPSSVITIERRA